MVTATNVDAKLLVRQQGQLNWNFHPRIQSDLSVSLPSGALPMNPAGVCRLRMSLSLFFVSMGRVLVGHRLHCYEPPLRQRHLSNNGLGYRSRTRTRTLTLTITIILTVTKMYAVQNDTGIKVNIVLHIKLIWTGGGYTKGP